MANYIQIDGQGSHIFNHIKLQVNATITTARNVCSFTGMQICMWKIRIRNDGANIKLIYSKFVSC